MHSGSVIRSTASCHPVISYHPPKAAHTRLNQVNALTSPQFAQELLSTFNTDLGEVALVPMTGGVFTVTIFHAGRTSDQGDILWDRKRDGGFPGTCPID